MIDLPEFNALLLIVCVNKAIGVVWSALTVSMQRRGTRRTPSF